MHWAVASKAEAVRESDRLKQEAAHEARMAQRTKREKDDGQHMKKEKDDGESSPEEASAMNSGATVLSRRGALELLG